MACAKRTEGLELTHNSTHTCGCGKYLPSHPKIHRRCRYLFDVFLDALGPSHGPRKVYMQLTDSKVTVRVGVNYIPLAQWTKELLGSHEGAYAETDFGWEAGGRGLRSPLYNRFGRSLTTPFKAHNNHQIIPRPRVEVQSMFDCRLTCAWLTEPRLFTNAEDPFSTLDAQSPFANVR